MFLGEDLLEWMVLALGSAIFIGNVGAVVRPREQHVDGELERAPLVRSLGMGLVGFFAAFWALASLVNG